ncbi:hypothetical protein N7478_001131 [Penicillium angulare]|uniref:uncharacterized protein n=1 Tax=Penicillium angulare TaxID=116970 RepID=UPI002540923C|nr:uncharacterized protein N7478_001131 [Penicillium angulare]KAJ5291880.1 hypothetical protein N7478_001131 [Penicillium angulare]
MFNEFLLQLLYSLDREPDDMTATQGLLLMSQYYPSADEQRHTWLWAYQAIGLAQGLGMHRVGKIGAQKKLWGRIWWACVVRDRLIALGTGRPMHINTLDCNIPVPDHSDLEEVGDDDEQRSIKAVYIDLLRLCQCAEGVLSLSTAASGHDIDQVELCERMLQRWVSNVTPTVGPPHESYPDLGKQSIAIMYRIILELTLKSELHLSFTRSYLLTY